MSNQEILAAANAAFNAGDVERTIATVSQISPEDPQAYSQGLLLLGRAMMRKKKFEDARRYLEESYSVRKNARTLFHLGECYYQAGDREHAEECLVAAAQHDDTLTDAHILLGIVCREAGRPKDAIASFDRALKNDPKAVVARYQLAHVAYELGDMQRAAAQLHHVLQHADDFVPAHLLLANITIKHGDYRQAVVEFCRVLELSGPDPAVYMSLGRAFAHLQDFKQALMAFEAVFHMNPENEQACSAAARLAERLGEKDKAVLFYKHMLLFEGSKELATEALKRFGVAAEAPPKTKRKGAAAPMKAVEFQPPKMIDMTGLPSSLPAHNTGRLITANGTQPLNNRQQGVPQQQAAQPVRKQPPAPTTPLDNLFDGLNKIIDKTPLKGQIDLQGMNDMANTMVNRFKSEVLSKVQRPGAAAPSQTPARPPQPHSTGNLSNNRPKPKP